MLFEPVITSPRTRRPPAQSPGLSTLWRLTCARTRTTITVVTPVSVLFCLAGVISAPMTTDSTSPPPPTDVSSTTPSSAASSTPPSPDSSSPPPKERTETLGDALDREERRRGYYERRIENQSGYAWAFAATTTLQVALAVTRMAMLGTEICPSPKLYVTRDPEWFFNSAVNCAPNDTGAVVLIGLGVKAASFAAASAYGSSRYHAFEEGKVNFTAHRRAGIALMTIGVAGWVAGRFALSAALILQEDPLFCPLADLACMQKRWIGGVAGIEASQLLVTTGIALFKFGEGSGPLRLRPLVNGRISGLAVTGAF